MRYYSIDLETTGLVGQVHGVTEFAAVLGDLTKPDLTKTFYRWVNPEGYVWSNYCLRLHAAWIDRVTLRLSKKHVDKEGEPKICNSLREVLEDFSDWLVAVGEMEKRITPTGKNFGSFDKNFLHEWTIFRHRTVDWVPYYQSPNDKVPPELELCKRRAIQAGAQGFRGPEVKHNALDDALDVHLLIQFAYNQCDLRKLQEANLYIPQVERVRS